MIDHWERKYFEPGGGEPFLFYVVYGSIDVAAPLRRSHYRSAGVPEGLEVMHYSRDGQAEVVDSFRTGYLWERLQLEEPEFADRIAAATECMVLRGTPSVSSNLNYLRDAVGLLTHLLDHGGICIFDPQMFQWWQPESWKEHIFEPAASVPRAHVYILISEEETPGLCWVHTRGLRKFGRPDFSVRNVTVADRPAVIDLINRLIEMQAFGHIVLEGKDIRVSGLPKGMTCHHLGHLDDPAFNNVHVEIRQTDG